MIFGHIENTGIDCYPSAIKEAINYLKNTNFKSIQQGNYIEKTNNFIVQVIDLNTKASYEIKPETHKKNIDIQFLYSGDEYIGFGNDLGKNPIKEDLFFKRDIAFYNDIENESFIHMRPGNYIIFFPEDMHRPGCTQSSSSSIRKIVIKIPLSYLN